MGSRTELYQITRELRRYLEWQAEDGLSGVLPAPAAERDAWQEREKARAAVRTQAMRDALFADSEKKAPASRGAAAGFGADRKERSGARSVSEVVSGVSEVEQSPVSSGGGLWNELGSRPRPTFQAVEEPVARSRSDVERSDVRRSDVRRSEPVQKSVTQPVSAAPESPPVMEPDDDFGGYDESYIDYSEDYSEFNLSAPPVEVEKPVRRVEMTRVEKLEFLKDYLGDCRRCPLHQGRTHVVFGDGNPEARLMFIGESPGKEEDRQGVPFVGVAGDLLNRMIEAMGFERKDVYVASVVKCRSSENRNPDASEVRECSPFLLKQIEVVEPEVIVALGGLAAQTLLGNGSNFTQLRGRWHDWKGIPVLPTYNPNSLLRNERLKRDAWNDLQLVMARLAEKK